MIFDRRGNAMKNINRLSGHSSIMKAGGGRQGSILVFLIVLMVISAAIGVGMVSMFGSSVLSTFASNSARRANYLAESGLRYAISEVRNALPTPLAREASLTNIDPAPADPGYIDMNGKWFNVFPGVARYRVRVYPYWSKTTTTGVNITVVAATVPNSGFPPLFAIPTAPGGASVARLHTLGGLVGISSAPGATAGSTAVTYNLASAVTLTSASYANLAFPTTNASQTVTKGSAATPLVLNINAVSAIPQKNGQFMDATSTRLYTYQTARMEGSTVQLEGINWGTTSCGTTCSLACLTACPTATFPAGSYLVFSQAARLNATGDVAGGYIQTQKSNDSAVTLFGPSSGMTMPGPNQTPPALTDVESGFSGNLDALDLTKSGDRVVVQGYIATGGTHAYWAAFQHLGEVGYKFIDPEEPGRYIGWHVVPIANDIGDNLRNTWMQYHNLSYDVQIKNGWDLNKYNGGSGLAVRWHESPLFEGQVPSGNDPYQYYQGYGITFMIYKDNDHNSDDMIPNNIKPPDSDLKKTLVLVLWEQKVDAGGVPTKDWLAYALLGDPSGNYWNPVTKGERSQPDPDQKVTGYQVWPDGRVNDNATIVVRVEDKFVTTGGVTTRYNDIKVFYGDASEYTFQNDSRTKDTVAINKQRARYYPKWLETGAGGTLAPINPRWPSNWFGLSGATIANWYGSSAGPATDTYDYFSLTNTVPMAPFNSDEHAVVWVKNDSPRTGAGFSAVNLLDDKCTIRTTDFVLDSFPSGRREIGLVGMGDISGANLTVAFDDFYIQMLGGL